MDIKKLVQDGVNAAKEAEAEFIEKHDELFFCGFAWVEVVVTRTNSQIAKELLNNGFTKSYKPKTLSMWNPGGSNTQSMDVKEQGAYAMAEVLKLGGLRAYACSRAD